MRYRDVTPRDWLKAGLYIALTIGTMVVTMILLIPLGPVGIAAWLGVASGSMYLLVRWHANSTAYRCSACSSEFEISVLTDLVSPHWGSRKYLRCPECGRRDWATILMKAT